MPDASNPHPIPLSGTQVTIDHGDYSATIASIGASLRTLRWQGRDLVIPFDADEVLPATLVAEIAALFAAGDPAQDAYKIRIAEIFPGEAAPHRFAYALAPVRLYRRDKGRYSPSPVHDRVDLVEGARVGKLKSTIHHYSVRSLGEQMDKLNAYSDAQADDLDKRGVTLSAFRLMAEFPANFIKAYIGRRHALRGVYGFMTAMNFAFYRYLRVAKHWERRLQRRDSARGD